LARKYLEHAGYAVRHCNWRGARGEIDLIVEKDGRLVVVEVKSRRSWDFGSGEEAVTARKLAALERCALEYMTAEGFVDCSWQVDVIAVDLDTHGGLIHMEHYQDVLQR
jgi:putative endonuclease